jgi:hypothetical protein
MQDDTPTLDITVLNRAADAYARAVRDAPEDAAARIELAWCTLVQAVWQAAVEYGRCEERGATKGTPQSAQPSVAQRIRDSIQHALIAEELSDDALVANDAMRIRVLLWQLGCDEIVSDVDKKVRERGACLLREIIDGTTISQED